jgi:predicted site-specific integrase-resolvase
LLRPRQVAAALGVNEDTLHRWRAAGRGPEYIRLPDGYAYSARDFEAWQDRFGAPRPPDRGRAA